MRKIIVAALGAFGGTLGYGYILNAPKNTILPASFIGLAGYIVYILLGMAGFGTMSAYFFSTVFVSVVCKTARRSSRGRTSRCTTFANRLKHPASKRA